MKKTISIFSLIIMVVTLCCFCTMPVFASTSNTLVDEEETYRYMVYAPNVSITPYYMAVEYRWTPGINGDYVTLSNNEVYFSPLYTEHIEVAFPSSVDKRLCIPFYKYGKSFDSRTAQYSPLRSLEHIETMVGTNGNTYQLLTMGFKPQYNCEGFFEHGALPVNATVPTSFNQAHYKWNHNHSAGQTIKATISYGNATANFEIKAIPSIFAITTTVNLNGIEFVMRIGNKTIQLRTKNYNVSPFELKFAFGVDPVQHPSPYCLP